MDERDWEEFKAKLKRKTEIDLDLYKAPQMQRRIMNLARRNGYDKYSAYFDKVVQDKDDFAAFIEYLTINVSEFFRTPDKFAKLETDVIPELMKRSSRLNIWSAGCSSGEEAYTTAMHINEFLGKDKTFWDTRILATDISLKTLAGAQNGIYQTSGLSDLPPGWIDKYFDRINEEKCKVKPSLRKEVIFRTFNLMEPIPYKKAQFDLIFCRNVMIYFEMDTKIALVKRFFDVLRPGGYLFIGHAESIPREATKYEYIKPAIYRKPLK